MSKRHGGKAEAQRVTRELLALKPVAFPATEPEPTSAPKPHPDKHPPDRQREGSGQQFGCEIGKIVGRGGAIRREWPHLGAVLLGPRTAEELPRYASPKCGPANDDGAASSSRASAWRWWSNSSRAIQTGHWVTGCIYNGDNHFPYDLPSNKTQSGLKTDSSKSHNGYSEFMFEDKKRGEFIRMHVERDHLVTVNQSRSDRYRWCPNGWQKRGTDTMDVQTGDQTITIDFVSGNYAARRYELDHDYASFDFTQRA